ncbi:hypothetical protein B0T26DRAFT_650723 [Lasiosphaeria miniovina]|uniref:Microbial-type PARG catalytic domain-containing protein n=1 Tax=Lasiosphaeria miniovina TaxID=1954250 RepID=A0AA40AE43_9PEZI|nr:uncharacterized protein B0T26DRAFT_650723 [Lasiosphaeria miniovina]KAK0714137.1 hypothetical protein B0T26DRAFT_650723 [Lasiosphaeria miniovina]
MVRATDQKAALRATAQETLDVLPGLLSKLGRANDARRSGKFTLSRLPRLGPSYCPRFRSPATVKVVNDDTLNAALWQWRQQQRYGRGGNASDGRGNPRPAVVNFGDQHSPGGGWLNGALAQEEALCYRSSLALSLHRRDYPLRPTEAVYSPYVLVVRDSLADGARLFYPQNRAADLPDVAAITVSAVRRPKVFSFDGGNRGRFDRGNRDGADGAGLPYVKTVFANNRDRNHTKDKMRLVLRIAAMNGHRNLVLGALGCGVFQNPPEDVAHCWLEVLREHEFKGNWWRNVCFAVFDPRNDGNFDIFKRVLHGKQV